MLGTGSRVWVDKAGGDKARECDARKRCKGDRKASGGSEQHRQGAGRVERGQLVGRSDGLRGRWEKGKQYERDGLVAAGDKEGEAGKRQLWTLEREKG
eukprot:3033150-Pleurochrysis_carterae.AAC.1